MGRPLRLKAPNLTYHITSRTNGKRILFKKEPDFKGLCRALLKTKLKHGVKIHAFTPMGNHFHLIVHVPDNTDISKFMCEFKTAYAKYFNTKYNSSGHFWGDRFKSTIIQDDKHMLACLRYVDRNPIKAGLVDHPEQWMQNSYALYAYGKQHEILPIEPHATYLSLSHDPTRRQQIYRDFVIQPDAESDRLSGTLPKLQIYGSQKFVFSFA